MGRRLKFGMIGSHFSCGSLVREWDSVCALMDKEAPRWHMAGSREPAPKTYHKMELLRVEGLRLRYPEATIETRKDGSLSSMWNGGEPSMVSLRAGDLKKASK